MENTKRQRLTRSSSLVSVKELWDEFARVGDVKTHGLNADESRGARLPYDEGERKAYMLKELLMNALDADPASEPSVVEVDGGILIENGDPGRKFSVESFYERARSEEGAGNFGEGLNRALVVAQLEDLEYYAQNDTTLFHLTRSTEADKLLHVSFVPSPLGTAGLVRQFVGGVSMADVLEAKAFFLRYDRGTLEKLPLPDVDVHADLVAGERTGRIDIYRPADLTELSGRIYVNGVLVMDQPRDALFFSYNISIPPGFTKNTQTSDRKLPRNWHHWLIFHYKELASVIESGNSDVMLFWRKLEKLDARKGEKKWKAVNDGLWAATEHLKYEKARLQKQLELAKLELDHAREKNPDMEPASDAGLGIGARVAARKRTECVNKAEAHERELQARLARARDPVLVVGAPPEGTADPVLLNPKHSRVIPAAKHSQKLPGGRVGVYAAKMFADAKDHLHREVAQTPADYHTLATSLLIEADYNAVALAGAWAATLLRAEMQVPQRTETCVLLLIDEWGTEKGGISAFNMQMARGLATEGVRTFVAVFDPKWCRVENPDGVARLVLVQGLTINGAMSVAMSPSELAAVTHVVGHDVYTGEHARVLTQESRLLRHARFVVMFHTMPDYIKSFVNAKAKKVTLRKLREDADVTIGVGPLIEDHHTLTHAFNPPLNPSFIPPTYRRRPSKNPHILAVGRFPSSLDADDQSKGLGRLLEAVVLAKTNSTVFNNSLLILRGIEEPGKLEQEMKVRYKDINVSVRPMGSHDDVKGDLEDASVFVMPSDLEPFGLVALEALAMGVPVIVRKSSGIWTACAEMGEAEYIVRPADTEDEIAGALVDLFKNPTSDVFHTNAETRAKQARELYTQKVANSWQYFKAMLQ